MTGAAPPPLLACSGADPTRARREAERLVREGAEALLSFGLAGGLIPGLSSGEAVFSNRVILPDGSERAASTVWRENLIGSTAGSDLSYRVGPVLGSERIITDTEQKRALGKETGALVVDMESHAVAEAAAAAGLPFMAIRAVSDTVDEALPRSALGVVDEKGRPKPLMVVSRLCLVPWEIPALLRVRRGTMAALGTLGRIVRILGPTLFSVK